MTEKINASGLRTLGTPGKPKRASSPKRAEGDKKLADKAKKTLRAEFSRAMDLKQKLATESASQADAKGRDAGEADKLRSIVASLEGMSRFAIAMGILTPQENRAIWAEHIEKGLYEGWR